MWHGLRLSLALPLLLSPGAQVAAGCQLGQGGHRRRRTLHVGQRLCVAAARRLHQHHALAQPQPAAPSSHVAQGRAGGDNMMTNVQGRFRGGSGEGMSH